MNPKDRLRSLTLGRKKEFKKTIVEIEGAEFELRQPTIGERGEIRNHSMRINTSDGDKDEEATAQFDMFAFLLSAVIKLTYVPGTDDKVFTDEDIPELKAQPAGGWFDELTKAASKLCNVKDDDVKKGSGETSKDS